MTRRLFREEALEAQSQRALGDVIMSTPPGTRALTVVATLVIGALIVFACFGHYTRKAHVTGYLAPDKGLIKVYATATGTLIEKRIAEGQTVKKGQTLFILSTEHGSPETPAAQQAVIASLQQRHASLKTAFGNQSILDLNQRRNLEERLRGLESESKQLDSAMQTQTQRLASAEETAARYRELAAKGYVAQLQLREKIEQTLEQKSRLESLQRERIGLLRSVEDLRRQLQGYDLDASNRRAAIQRDIESLNQQLLEYESRRNVAIAAPADGTVTAILAETGQTAGPNAPLLSILPAETVLVAQLLVPSRAVGFIEQGQHVALRYQAFPYQRFGSARGSIKEIARTLISPGEAALPVPLHEPVYRVTVALHDQSIPAYRRKIALQSGMQLDADVWLDRRRIIEWVFDPIYSVTGRI